MSKHEETPQGNVHAAGLAIAISAVASIAAVAMDSMAPGTDMLSRMQGMVSIQQPHMIVHLVVLACLLGLTFGFVVFSRRLGLHRTPVMMGLIAYCLGSFLMVVAAVLDGFVSTDTASMFVNRAPDVMQIGYWIMNTLEIVVLSDVAKVAWIFQSVAVVCWAIALLPERGMRRVVGVIGLVAGGAPAVAVFVVGSHMTASVVVGILLLQAVWNFSAAALLLSSKLTKPASAGAPALSQL
ncbi:MAG: hypothetical protein ACHQAU_06090 [Gammaproteobacteria bacterium]